METCKIILPGIAGTSAMTLFSYLVSNNKEENYREPEVLEIMIKRLQRENDTSHAAIMAWSLHYLVGIFFTCFYARLPNNKNMPAVLPGLGFGAVCGLAGITGWKIAYTLHPDPPAKNLQKYFGHLFLAHLVFGVAVALCYKRK